MAVNPNKPGTLAYTVWEQNQAKKMAQPQVAKPQSMVVKGGTIETAKAIESMAGGTQPATGITTRAPATVATPQNPVISKSMTRGFVPNTSDIDQMDASGLQDFIDTYKVKAQFGSVKEEDAIKAVKAQRLLSGMQNTKASEDTMKTYQDAITKAEADRQALLDEMKRSGASARQIKEEQLAQAFERQKQEQLASGERQKQATQTALSTSGFGRSTYNAEQQQAIQKQTDASIQALAQARELELARFDAEQQGANAETMSGIDANIAMLKGQAQKAQADAIAEADRINKQTGAGIDESISNLIQTAKQSGLDIKASDEGAIKMLTQIVRKNDGSLDEAVLSALPDGIREIVRAGATSGYGVSNEPAKTISIGSGRSERVLQWNPSTGRYDIPVSGSFAGVGGGTAGGGTSGGGKQTTAGGTAPIGGLDYSSLTFKNQDQASAFGYVNRMVDAENIFKTTEPLIASKSIKGGIIQRNLPSALQDDLFRQQEQAEKNFINAVLRRESGAAISASEFSNARKQYLPMPGDDKKTLEQKKQNRATVMLGLASATGPGASKQVVPFVQQTISGKQTQPTTPTTQTQQKTTGTSSGKKKALSLMK